MAQQVLTQRDRMLAQAQEEANRTLSLAREKGEQLIERDSIVQTAQVRAEQRVSEVLADAEQTRREADNYVVETLTKLEMELDRYLNQVRNGIMALREDQKEPEK
jgi:F0F1-type ATP synthase membrane subunit b/b'